jgi:acetyltransferase-like isoleucine patch superfamily enzyme
MPVFGPGVTILTTDYCKDPDLRKGTKGYWIANDVYIASGVVIGANAVILAGVKIDEGATVDPCAVVRTCEKENHHGTVVRKE